MTCPTCLSEMLLVAAPGKLGNWCCTRGAACEQRAIPEGRVGEKAWTSDKVVGKDFERVKFDGQS